VPTTPAVRVPVPDELPRIVHPPPGPESVRWLARFAANAAPMGPRRAEPEADVAGPFAGSLVYRAGHGSNVIDVDGNRYVDLAAGFGSLLLGHAPASTQAALHAQAERLLQALGDVYPSDVKVELLEDLCALYAPEPARCILGQSGADAISAALKTAALHSGKPGVIAFAGAYHGLSYGPLALCGLRDSYRAPFSEQLNPHVRVAAYPTNEAVLGELEAWLGAELARGDIGALVFEPIAGRAGCLVPPAGFAPLLGELARRHGALLVADEIWTGLGRSGHWLYSFAQGARPDLVCLGKGLGGGLPLSACIGRASVMQAWSRDAEVVHTSTFAGAPLACAAGLATLAALRERELVLHARELGASFLARLRQGLERFDEAGVAVRGEGLMIGIDLGQRAGAASLVQRRLLERGWIVSSGGGLRQVVVLTPALTIDARVLEAALAPLVDAVAATVS
jgi:4-aminobutyrate aminotransferase / (S)-3-amino-2-methylpropionate transaminase / 5-aminovalerate transaminase